MSRNLRADRRAKRRRRERYQRWKSRRRYAWRPTQPISPSELAAYRSEMAERVYAVMGLSLLTARRGRP